MTTLVLGNRIFKEILDGVARRCSDCGAVKIEGTPMLKVEGKSQYVCLPCENQLGSPGHSAECKALEIDRTEVNEFDFSSVDRQVAAWKKGARSERKFAVNYANWRSKASASWILHDLTRGESGNIDHLAVGPSGIVVVDSKDWSELKVKVLPQGSLRIMDGACDKTEKLLGQMRSQVNSLQQTLNSLGLREIPLVGCICFHDRYQKSMRRLEMPDVLIRDFEGAFDLIEYGGVLEVEMITEVVEKLSAHYF